MTVQNFNGTEQMDLQTVLKVRAVPERLSSWDCTYDKLPSTPQSLRLPSAIFPASYPIKSTGKLSGKVASHCCLPNFCVQPEKWPSPNWSLDLCLDFKTNLFQPASLRVKELLGRSNSVQHRAKSIWIAALLLSKALCKKPILMHEVAENIYTGLAKWSV